MKIKHTTRLGTLLEKYPQLKLKLTALLPAFSDLEQRPLKEKVLQITTVEHLARLTDREVPELIRELKEAAGLNGEEPHAEDKLEFLPDDPDWIQTPPDQVIDGTGMLTQGKHPLSEVKSSLTGMDEGEILLLTTNFHPQPMIDAMEAAGREVYSRQADERQGFYLTFIRK